MVGDVLRVREGRESSTSVVMEFTSHGGVRVLEECRVSPPPGSVAGASLPLTFLDATWVFFGPVQRLFFYRSPHPTPGFIASVLPTLKSSLSLTLQRFYTLAGNLVRSDDVQREIRYTDGDSISFTLAECDSDFDELSGKAAVDFAKIYPLVPQLPSRDDAVKPLLAVQVTVFPNHGFSIGVAIHHAAGDGMSSAHFLKSWASVCRGGGAEPASPPIYDRTLIPDHDGLADEMLRSGLLPTSGAPTPSDRVLAWFTLGRHDIQRLKQKAAAGAGAESFHCSAFVVSCAYAWLCLVRTRGCATEGTAHFTFAADCRGRVRPRIPESYFGNCLRPCFVEVKAEELAGADGFVAASKAIGRAIVELNEIGLADAGKWMERMSRFPIGSQYLSVAGSPRFRIYDTDFGWGRAEKVAVASIGEGNSISLAESRDGEGGVEIGLVLPKHQMVAFQAHFSTGVELLSS